MKDDYEIRYRKPPVHTRFVKGKCGNPNGSPRKRRYGHRSHRSHTKDDLVRLLPLKIHAPEGGRGPANVCFSRHFGPGPRI
jgi:hypothetical protein